MVGFPKQKPGVVQKTVPVLALIKVPTFSYSHTLAIQRRDNIKGKRRFSFKHLTISVPNLTALKFAVKVLFL